jgi:hypothetical protein
MTATSPADGAQLQQRIKALRLPPGANDETRALYSNLKRHGARMPAAQAERLLTLIEESGKCRPDRTLPSAEAGQLANTESPAFVDDGTDRAAPSAATTETELSDAAE